MGYSRSDVAVTRYEPDGDLDTTFSTDGKQTTSVTAGTDIGYDVVIEADGKIVVGGHGNNDFAVLRYDASGNLDTTFDTDGIVVARN